MWDVSPCSLVDTDDVSEKVTGSINRMRKLHDNMELLNKRSILYKNPAWKRLIYE
jgi:hypothetical protein